jgi:hypothetical protein
MEQAVSYQLSAISFYVDDKRGGGYTGRRGTKQLRAES